MAINVKGVMEAIFGKPEESAEDQTSEPEKPAPVPLKNRKWRGQHKAILRQSGTKRLFASLNKERF